MRIALIAAFLVACCSPGASAQRGSAMDRRTAAPLARPSRFGPNAGGSFIGFSGARFDGAKDYHRYRRDSFFYGGLPYFPPDYYEDSRQEEIAPPAPAPQAVPVVQTNQGVPSGVLLELRGNRWVRVDSFTTGVSASEAAETAATVPVPKELPPAVLVYRDGHSEELSSYSIIGSTIFAKADYVTTGASSRKIEIAELDLAATVKQNHDRGVKFDLPSGPNEIILRP